MGDKRVANFSQCCLVILLILTDLPSLCSSPIPLLEDFLNHKSSAIPSHEKGQLSPQDPTGLLGRKQVIPRTDTARTLGSLTASQNSFNLKSTKAQGNSDLPESSKSGQSLMQLKVSRPSALGNVNLKPAQDSSGLPLGSGTQPRSGRQPWEFLPIKPQQEPDGDTGNIPLQINVDFDGDEHTENSVEAKPILDGQEFPLSGGMSLMNLGRLNLKTDWCNAHPFKETVRHHGCVSVEVDNKMCYGQCNSFYIPKKFFSCSYCAPSRQQTINVRLECPGQNPSFVIKKVLIVLECACKDCGLKQS